MFQESEEDSGCANNSDGTFREREREGERKRERERRRGPQINREAKAIGLDFIKEICRFIFS